MQCKTIATICLAVPGLLAGCAPAERLHLHDRTGGSAALYGQFRVYDGHTGRPLSMAQVARRCGAADVILFGEEHSVPVCNQFEAQLLYVLATQPEPIALAMEFFEADTQASLDAYLLRRIAEPAFREQARQGRPYVLSHRPLIELCRAANVPVVAANAPRKLVRAYRKSGLRFDEFRAGLDPADQRWLPTTNTYLTGDYEERFLGMMAGHGAPAPESQPATQPTSLPATQPTSAPVTQPASAPVSQPTTKPSETESPEKMYLAQLLWDESMAWSLASFRTRFPTHRILLIVGSFHVEQNGGTAIKLRALRPHDRVVTIVYRSTEDGRFEFDAEDRGAGDMVVYGIAPPPETKREGEPPASMPSTMPARPPASTTTPASRPSTMPAPSPV